MKEEIFTEIRKIPSLNETEKIKSFIVFNLNEDDKTELFNSISSEFLVINEKLNELREKEIIELYNSHKPSLEKYEELEKRYENTERIDYVRELHSEIRQEKSKMISESSTHSSRLKRNHRFIELNLTEYIEKEKRFEHLNKNMDFTNLINVNRENPNFLYYKLTKEEEEYEELKKYFENYKSSNSLVSYCINYEPRFDELLNSEYSIQYLSWFFLAFKISKSEFDTQFSERTKYWLYSDNTVIIE
ncbi:hypothetical protein [Flavobacterium psychrophilum]|uniref:hypothetical protein n=1 Tax=Flavobacterium psychrophilum TaxID=96345 RepID=UPI0009044B71|nr:hypothetical protein [Flavobacterium psychrophilum]EKT2070785.1 hypothetical protein [Flavobacterium psychrophilum]EKT4490294.1 hypothetical protein [Flavobacterium psychrophilum]OJH13823.1 hypothetical protein FPG87_02760 [Flavobacterium psychrophilum]SHH80060.1 Hypothetical protein THC0290_0573 [Flavobacterium psychrophilum]